jgi:hypothetical protein
MTSSNPFSTRLLKTLDHPSTYASLTYPHISISISIKTMLHLTVCGAVAREAAANHRPLQFALHGNIDGAFRNVSFSFIVALFERHHISLCAGWTVVAAAGACDRDEGENGNDGELHGCRFEFWCLMERCGFLGSGGCRINEGERRPSYRQNGTVCGSPDGDGDRHPMIKSYTNKAGEPISRLIYSLRRSH